MTKKEFFKLPIGLYVIYWQQGEGPSIASIGVTTNGGRWIAPDNWVLPATSDDIRNDGSKLSWWLDISKTILICRRVKVYNENGTSAYLITGPDES